MEISQITKYSGLLITAISAIVALLGKPREKGKFTKKGWILLFSIVFGLLTSITSEIYQSRESEERHRIDQEWEYLKAEKINFIGVEFFTTGQAKIADFIQFTNLTEIELKNGYELGSAALKFRIDQTGNADIYNSIRLVADTRGDNSRISSEQLKLYVLELHDNELRALYDHSKKNVSKDFKICGISSKIACQELRLKGISRIMDLINLDISINSPEHYNFPVALIGNYDPDFFFAIEIESIPYTFRIDPSMLIFRVVEDEKSMKHMSANIKGRDLFNLLRKQFYEHQKRIVDSSKEKGNLHSVTGIVSNIIEVRILRKI